MPDEPVLTGVGLSKHYGGVIAVDDCSLALASGEILGLVGPNGAGKTTLVDLITGAQPATAGKLMMQGRPLDGSPSKRARAGLARTFQHPLLALDLSVRDNLLLGVAAERLRTGRQQLVQLVRGMFRSESAADHDAAAALAKRMRLGDINRLARDLTLGEQRLVEVGRALAQSPLVLLLDEPFAGADQEGIAGILDALEVVKGLGHSIILVDHNVDLVASVVDRVMLLDRGQVRFDGTPEACLASTEMQTVYFGAQAVTDVA